MRRRLKILVDADQIRRMRAARSWSQEGLAAVSGLSARTVQRIESDGVASLESRRALAAAFGVNATEIAARQGYGTPAAGAGITGADAAASFIDHPAPSAGLTSILVAAAAGSFAVLMIALDIDSDSRWLGRLDGGR